MNILKKFPALLLCGAAFAFGFSSCSDDSGSNESSNEKNELMRQVLTQYVNNTVYTTYAKLADETSNLYDKLKAAKNKMISDPNSLKQSDIDEICETFIKARAYYEESEGFLYGAATDFGVDPHIDTWPLAVSTLAGQLSNKNHMAIMSGDDDDAIAFAGSSLGQELLGFHGIEFIIFRNGANRKVADFLGEEQDQAFKSMNVHVTGKEELIYATAVAGDLRDRCWQLEVSWNENAPKAHADRVEELELPHTVSGGSYSYGKNMLEVGNAGSTYVTLQEAMVTIIKAGCENICNEVANVKIGNPYGNGKEPDPNYIESPYSQRSFIDFKDNILSIENSLYGGRSENRDLNKSIIHYMKVHNYSGLAKLESDLTAAIQAIETCQNNLKGGFVNNIKDPLVGKAQLAIQALDDDLNNAADWFAKQ